MNHDAHRALLRELAATEAGAEFTCKSGSMEPTIRVGQKVRVHERAASAIRVGDIVVYEGKEAFILHRIVLIAPGRRWFLHIGDAPSGAPPRRALMSSVIGVVDALPRRRPHPRVLWRAARHALRSLVR